VGRHKADTEMSDAIVMITLEAEGGNKRAKIMKNQ
jgi:hypothetical protein